MMTILVIGNGFDKALGLPTDYADFLKFASYMKWFVSDEYNVGEKAPETFGIDKRIAEQIKAQSGNISKNLFSRKNDIKVICHNNFWLEYFAEKQDSLIKQGKDRWVDFETEITKQVALLENVVSNATDGIDNDYETNDLEDVEAFYQENGFELTTYRDIHDKLLIDLDNLTWLMGFYYAEFVEKIEITDIPVDVRNILNGINGNDAIRVISFNYTHFLENYLKSSGTKFEIDYVHGVADSSKSVGTNNMVLGAATGEDNLDFADFKKYFQRILKKTDHKFIDWLEKASNHFETINRNGVHPGTVPFDRVFFFGHSMDLTDADIIESLVMAPNMRTTIYCYRVNEEDHKDMAQKIKNIQSIISRDEVIKKTNIGGTLRFI